MPKGTVAVFSLLVLLSAGVAVEAATPTPKPILAGPLAKLDIKEAQIEAGKGKPKGTLTIAQHYALDPGWLDPLEHQATPAQGVYDHMIHDAVLGYAAGCLPLSLGSLGGQGVNRGVSGSCVR
jgi:hypothetical protein